MSMMRKRSGDLQVPFDVWIKNGHIVRLEGVIHVAPQAYWENREAYLLEGLSKGHSIHLEGIRKSDKATEDLLPEKALKGLKALFESQKTMAAAAGLVHQKNGMPTLYEKVPTEDFTTEQVLVGFNREKLEKLADAKPLDEIADEMEKEHPGLFGKIVLFILRHIGILNVIATVIAKKPILDPLVILKGRNEYAINKMLEHQSPTTTSIMLWGAAHLPGMRKLLRKAGYKRFSTGWLTIIPRTHTVDGAS